MEQMAKSHLKNKVEVANKKIEINSIDEAEEAVHEHPQCEVRRIVEDGQPLRVSRLTHDESMTDRNLGCEYNITKDDNTGYYGQDEIDDTPETTTRQDLDSNNNQKNEEVFLPETTLQQTGDFNFRDAQDEAEY